MSESIHIVCGHCDSVVRIPRDRLADRPVCPKCHQSLFDGHPAELKTMSFDKHLTRNDVPVVVDFWAPWCGPCLMMAPHYEETARKFGPRARFAKVNSDEEPSLSARYGIRSIPTLIAFSGGKEIARQSGAMQAMQLQRWLESVLR